MALWEHSPGFGWSVIGSQIIAGMKGFLLWERGTVEAEFEIEMDKQGLRE